MSEIRNMNGSSNDTSNTFDLANAKRAQNVYMPDYTDPIFQRLDAQDVEHFYKSYHFWSLQQRLKTLHTEIGAVQQAITDNGTLMQQLQLSAIALASLAQLQASGVNDLNLLDRMLERGETWLDHTMQLLEHCEELDVIGGDYTQWCEHALEGAYDWIESINAKNALNTQENEAESPADSLTTSNKQQTNLQEVTEEQLLQKLMSDEDTAAKIPALSHPLSETEQVKSSVITRKITQPLQQPEQEAVDPSLPTRKITQPLLQPEQEAADPSLPTRKITQPLLQLEAPAEIPESQASGPLQEGQPHTSEEETEEGITHKMVANHSRTVTVSKDADVQEVEDATGETVVSAENSDQTRAASFRSAESPQESKKPQIRKVRRRGFWYFLSRLVAFLLRR